MHDSVVKAQEHDLMSDGHRGDLAARQSLLATNLATCGLELKYHVG